MEQTVNTFSKGLQMDTHPMVQGNDTLSNALNATFVTMNGNEVILQNDMGNRRVDGAFLPAGYEPVGIKEHGGIIYIASYNPITNKCQIGSFPSPQMNYGKEDDIYSTVDEDLFNQSFKESDFGSVQFQKNFSILSPFRKQDSTKDEVLRAGDKFCVYFSKNNNNQNLSEKISYFDDDENKTEELKKLITNYDNITSYSGETKLYSPKNKKYTLSLGVMNSQNQFTDFTPTLLRWDKSNKIIEFNSDTPDYIKFNTGYFIPKSFNSNDLGETINDATFIRNRLKLPANTYIYKLAGPLYIKKDLNVISNMTFNYYGSEINTSDSNINIKYQISLDIFYEYNCPDYNSWYDSSGDDKYFTYEDKPKSNNCFIGSNIKLTKYSEENIIWENDDNNWRTISDLVVSNNEEGNNEEGNVNEPIYNPITNTYRIKKHYILNDIIEKGEKYLLRIVPFTSYGLGIRNLSRLVLIDSDKLKSNELSINDFRFKREGNQMNICLGFIGYMAGVGGISNIKMDIIDDDENSPIIPTIEWGNEGGIIGSKIFEIPFNEKFKERRIYLVKISWDIDNSMTPLEAAARIIDFDDNDEEEQETTPTPTPTPTQEEQETTSTNTFTQVEYRWIVTTDLFNDFYSNSSYKMVKDYGNRNYYNDEFKEALVVKPDISIENEGEINISSSENLGNINNKTYLEKKEKEESKIILAQKKSYQLLGREIKLDLGEIYPIELEETTFSYEGENSIKLTIKESIEDDSINRIEFNDVDTYGNYKYGVKKYKEYNTTGFNKSLFTITKNNNTNNLVINYDGDFLIKEFISGTYNDLTRDVHIKNVFRSVFDTELTKDKLFDQCGAIGVNSYNDNNSINFTFQHNYENGYPESILKCESNQINTGEYYFGDYNDEYAENFRNFEISYHSDNNHYNYDIEAVSQLLSDFKFNNYITSVGSYINHPFFKFNFLNKNFIIGTTNQGIITSFESVFSGTKEGIYKHYEQFAWIRPIILWMRTDNNGNWAMLPLINTKYLINSKYISNKNNVYTNEEVANKVTTEDLEKYGYIGGNRDIENLILTNNTDNKGNSIYDIIIKYLKSRIKNFYYISNKSDETADLYKFKINENNIINNKLDFYLELKISTKSDVKENLSTPLKTYISSIFNTESNTSYINILSEEDGHFYFNSRKQEFDQFKENINGNEINYAIYDEGEYYISKFDFQENDGNKLLIKNNDNSFQRLEGIDVNYDDIYNNDHPNRNKFPFITPSYNQRCGIGVLVIRDGEAPRLGFDFKYNNSGAKYEMKSEGDNFPPTIPESLLIDQFVRRPSITEF